MGVIEAGIGAVVAIGGRGPRRLPHASPEELEDAYKVLTRVQRASRNRHEARIHRKPVPTLSEDTLYEYSDQPAAALPAPTIIRV